MIYYYFLYLYTYSISRLLVKKESGFGLLYFCIVKTDEAL